MLASWPGLSVENVVLEQAEERFHGGVVARGADSAHRSDQVVLVQGADELPLSSGRTDAVGLVVFDVRNPFLTDVARGVEDTTLALDHIVMLCNSDVDPDREHRYLDLMTEQRTQGVLINPCARPDLARGAARAWSAGGAA